ncbi:Bromodomain [Penicillium soppii]|uniref:Bromodomain n=1 Tax=Penicillium soppii TaxID=69789 RepID=UPI002546B943|nr:Bromodomain [Penicillium soppii]KAJ5871787.1 Bromodomain [Penicillium soppii]
MATPPPEAPHIVKEDKLQLPPSPAGPSATDIAPTSAHNDIDSKVEHPVDAEIKSPELNGHSSTATPFTNGTSTANSPPKSPAPATAPASSDQPQTQDQPSAEQAAAPQSEKTSPVDQESLTPAVNAENIPTQAPADIPTAPASTEGPVDTKDAMAVDTPKDLPTAVKTELPHHPNPDAASASLTATQPVDQEMKDVPEAPHSPSSSKISRQRDDDLSEEPAAKRTKVEGEASNVVDFKPPGFSTPATETAAPVRTSGGPGLTKLQHKFISKSLTSLKRMHDARFYKEPVDAIKLNIPQYHTIITQPMDLGTMEKKLKANQYGSPKEVSDDFALMVNNTTIFNGPDHLVTQEGIKLKATFEKQMLNLPKPEEVEPSKPKKSTDKTSAARRAPRTSLPSQPKAASPQGQTFALGPEGLPVIRRDSTNPDGRPKRSIHPPKRDLPYSTKPKKKKYQWELRFCQEALDEMHKQKHYNFVMPFYYPVDPVALNIPTYHEVIKKPMDLSTVQHKLKTGQYENAKEFETDVRLIFKNCFRFNIPGDPTYICGQRAEEIFSQKWAQKSDYLEAHEPHPEQNSDSSDEESDDEAEESDQELEKEKLALLQKQIAEMSRQVEAITHKKKKTPPSSKKIGKAKPVKKESKKISSGKKDKKSKSGKERAITYNEKQIISNGISSLPDKKMQQALQIIQSNVPQLKGTDEAEIELDIDELPNNVLLLLLNFVKKNVPHLMDDEDDLPASSSVAPPKPKKNKPMSKFEQEAQINMLQSNLSRFQGGAHSPEPVRSVEQNESSDDESDSSEEESEEE